MAAAASTPATSATRLCRASAAKLELNNSPASPIQARVGNTEQNPAAIASPQDASIPAVSPQAAKDAPPACTAEPAKRPQSSRTRIAGIAGCGRQLAVRISSGVRGARVMRNVRRMLA